MKLHSASTFVALMGLVFVCSLVQQAGAWGQKDVTLEKDDETATLDCNGTTVSVRGDDNRLTIRGECNKLAVSGDDNVISATNVKEVDVSGSDNTINVEIVGKISTSGDDNTIRWTRGVSGRAPEISQKGEDNKISQAGK